jgi:hypothetical protein
MHATLGFIAGFIAFISFIPYVISILKGETKPQRATFAIWSAINLVTLLSYFASGARETIWVLAVYTILQIGVFLLSLKYGMGGLEKVDLVCLAGAILGIVAWTATKDPVMALYISIAVEFLGWLPLIKKVYLHPKTENTLSWSLAGLAALLNLFALTSLQPDIISYPIYLFLSEGAIAILLLFPHLRFHNHARKV